MHSANQTKIYIKIVSRFIFHILFIFTVILLLFIHVLPYLHEHSLRLNEDEAFHAREIWELMQGRSIFFYYEEVNYHGILGGLMAIPFYKFLGVYPVPFKLPAIIFYGFFIWTTFLLLRTFNPIAGWVATILLLLPPPWIIKNAVILNVPFALIFFLGNLPFLYLVKKKINLGPPNTINFLLFYYSGLAIYAFSYSILHIFTVSLILVLTHPEWKHIRPYLTLRNTVNSFKNLGTMSLTLIRILETIIFLFTLAIIYSYIFGGFGLDIGGVTLFQINNLHKPVIQVAVLICIRLIFVKKYPMAIVLFIKTKLHSMTLTTKKMILIGTIGLILGIFPRIWSILNGSITRGGQGFDIDFSPIKLMFHFLDLISIRIFEVMSVRMGVFNWFPENYPPNYSIIQTSLYIPVTLLVSFATYSFIIPRWNTIKSIIRLESIKFEPGLILLIYPAILCVSTIITMNGPDLKYLVPIYWSAALYTAILISNIFNYSKFLSFALIGIWITFYGSFNIEHKYDLSNLREIFSPNEKSPIPKVVEFLKLNEIKAVYSTYGFASEIIMASNGEIAAAQFNKSARGKRLRRELENYPDFSIVGPGKDSLPVFLDFLDKNEISFKKEQIAGRLIIWNIKGDPKKINQLRNLIE